MHVLHRSVVTAAQTVHIAVYILCCRASLVDKDLGFPFLDSGSDGG